MGCKFSFHLDYTLLKLTVGLKHIGTMAAKINNSNDHWEERTLHAGVLTANYLRPSLISALIFCQFIPIWIPA